MPSDQGLSLARLTPFVAALLLTLAAHAQTTRVRVDIEPAPLDRAIGALARAAGIQVFLSSELAQGRTAPALHGEYTPREALERLVAGSGLTVRAQDEKTFTVERTPATQTQSQPHTLAEVQVVAPADTSGTTEGTRSYTARTTHTATRLPLSLRETPQSVSVVTRQYMEDFGLQSIEDIADNTTGLFLFKSQAERPSFYSRGFTVSNIAMDGSPLNFGGFSADTTGMGTLAVYDRVEIVRGASGLLTGTGNPSAVLNLVRKRPSEETQASLEGSVGRWNHKSMQLDAGGAINEARTFRVRTVANLDDSGTFVDGYKNQRGLLYAIAEADLSPATRLSFGGYYNREDNPGARGFFPYSLDGSPMPLPRSFNDSPDWVRWDKENLHGFAELEHRLANGWKGKLSYLYFHSTMDAQFSNGTRVGAEMQRRLTTATRYFYDQTHHAIDATASGPFSLLGRRHDLVVGAGVNRRTEENDGAMVPNAFVWDPLTQPRSLIPPPNESGYAPSYGQHSQIKQSHLYATARLSITDALTGIVGGRLDGYDYAGLNVITQARTAYKVEHEFTPYAGLVYDLDGQHSVYASFTSIFSPQSVRDRNGDLLDPVTGTNVEAGIKGEYFGGALNASAAVFQIRQKNLARSLAREECNGQLSCSEAAGEIKSHGFELELAGALSPAWDVQAGLSYATARYARSTSASTPVGTPYNTQTPKRLLRLATTYRLSGPLQGLRVGASLQYQSDIYSTNTWPYAGRLLEHGGATTVGLMAAYSVNRHLDLRLNVTNLTDKHYFQSIGNYGEPRNVRLSAKYTF